MWGFLVGCFRVIKGLFVFTFKAIGLLGQALTALNSGMDTANLQITMFNNRNKVKNQQPLDTAYGADTISQIYNAGVHFLNTQGNNAYLHEQHELLINYVDSIDLSVNCTNDITEIENILRDVVLSKTQQLKALNRRNKDD